MPPFLAPPGVRNPPPPPPATFYLALVCHPPGKLLHVPPLDYSSSKSGSRGMADAVQFTHWRGSSHLPRSQGDQARLQRPRLLGWSRLRWRNSVRPAEGDTSPKISPVSQHRGGQTSCRSSSQAAATPGFGNTGPVGGPLRSQVQVGLGEHRAVRRGIQNSPQMR